MTATDTTPLATRLALVATLVITGLTLSAVRFGGDDLNEPGDVASALWLLTALFVLRVAGQVLVVLRAPAWLPPMEQWNLVPYRVLLPIQLVFIAVMTWIDVSFQASSGAVAEQHHGFGVFLIVFSTVYVLAMAIRYVVRMRRRSDQRWFGGTIPIIFHVVLASYLYVLGSFYAA